jgi:hypothetical protein
MRRSNRPFLFASYHVKLRLDSQRAAYIRSLGTRPKAYIPRIRDFVLLGKDERSADV